MSVRQFIAVLAGLAVIGLLGFGLVKKGEGGVDVGEALPSAELPDLSGEGSGSIADHRGEWLLVNVWASWCGPCRKESPALEAFSRRHRGEVTVIGIDTRDLSDDGRDFVAEHGLTYLQLRDGDGAYAEDLGTTGVPESFLVDSAGDLAAHYPGPFRDEEAIREFAAPALAGGS